MASNSKEFTKTTYIFHFNLLGRDYYGGVGFTDRDAHSPFDTGTGAATAAVEGHEYLGYSRIPDLGVDRGIPCSSQFGADPVGASTTAANCSEINSLSLLGQVLSDLFTPEVLLVFGDQPEQLQRPDFESVLSQITSRQNSVLDFDVSVFALDGDSSTYGFVAECVAYAGRPEFVGRSWQEILDMDGVKGVMCAQRESRFPLPPVVDMTDWPRLTMRRCVHRGLDLTQRLVQAGQGGGSTTFPWSVNDNLLEKKAWVSRLVRHRSGKSSTQHLVSMPTTLLKHWPAECLFCVPLFCVTPSLCLTGPQTATVNHAVCSLPFHTVGDLSLARRRDEAAVHCGSRPLSDGGSTHVR